MHLIVRLALAWLLPANHSSTEPRRPGRALGSGWAPVCFAVGPGPSSDSMWRAVTSASSPMTSKGLPGT